VTNMHEKLNPVTQSNAARWALVWGLQAAIFTFSGLAAFWLRFDFSFPPAYVHYLVFALPVWIVVKSVIFQASNLNRWGLRYVTIADVHRIVIANCAGALLSWAILLTLPPRVSRVPFI